MDTDYVELAAINATNKYYAMHDPSYAPRGLDHRQYIMKKDEKFSEASLMNLPVPSFGIDPSNTIALG